MDDPFVTPGEEEWGFLGTKPSMKLATAGNFRSGASQFLEKSNATKAETSLTLIDF